MIQNTDRLAVLARHDEGAREKLIKQNTQTILRSAASVSNRYITTSDDEWSIALNAFSQAIDKYDEGKGEFLPFAQMVMKRGVIDYLRSQSKYAGETAVAPEIMEGNVDDEEDNEVFLAVAEQSEAASEHSLPDEIQAANEMFSWFGFSFYDLTSCSPKQDKTREDCARVIRFLLERPSLVLDMLGTKRLPIQEIVVGINASRKTLDKYRKYLIASVIILNGEFPQLAEYLKYIKRGIA